MVNGRQQPVAGDWFDTIIHCVVRHYQAAGRAARTL